MIKILDENDKQEIEQRIGKLSNEIADQQEQIKESTGYLVGFEFTGEYVPQNIYEFEAGDIETDGSFNNNDWLRRRKFECVGRKKVFIAKIEHSKARPTICCYDSKGVFLLGVYTNDSSAEQELECITPTNTAYIYVCAANQNNFDTVKIYDSEAYYIQKSYKYKYTNIFVGAKYDKHFSDFDNFYHNMKFNQTTYKSNLVSDDYWHKLGYSSAYRIECIAENSEFKAILKMLNRHSYKPTYNVGDVINIAFKYKSVGDFVLRLRSGANTVSEETLDTYGDFTVPNSRGLVQEFKCSFSIDTLNSEYGFITPQFCSNGNVLNDYIEFVDFAMLQNEDILEGYNYLNKCEVSEFSDLNIMYLGDSITAGPTYSIFVNNLLKPKSVVNVAVGGASLTDKIENQTYDGNPISENENNVAGNQVQKIINNNYDAPDIIVFAFGTNDRVITDTDKNFENQFTSDDVFIPLSSVDRTTFGGAMRYCIETLHNKYPNAQIFIMTPIQSAEKKSGDGLGWYYSKLKPKADLIKALGNRMSVPVIDCFSESRIYGAYENSSGNGEYLADGLHPNENGSIRMGKFVANEIRNRYIF